MLQINIISIGKLTSDLLAINQHYLKMIRWPIKFTEISYNKKLPSKETIEHEGQLIKNCFNKKGSYKAILDRSGVDYDSISFSKIFNKVQLVEFVIGGAFGLSKELIDECDLNLSLSKLTLPHDLARIILIEQIYRSQTILSNHPYHK